MGRFTICQIPPNPDFVRKFGVQVPSKPDEYRMNCPYCGHDDGKFYVNLRSGFYQCFRGCPSAKGKMGSNSLANKLMMVVTDSVTQQKRKIEAIHFSMEGGTPEGDFVIEYLNNRGITIDTARMFGLQGATVMGSIAVAFPVRTPLVVTKYFGYRLINHEKLRYYTDFPKVLYGHPATLSSDIVYVQEGAFDVLGSIPLKSVCLFGKNLLGDQLNLLKHFKCKSIYICLDAEVASSKKEQMALKIKIATGKEVGIVQLPPGKDPGDLGKGLASCGVVKIC